MLRGFSASILLHAGVLATSYIVLPYAREPLQTIEIVPVDIVNVSEVTNVAAVVERRTELPPAEEPTPPEEPDLEDFLEDVDTLPEDVEDVAEEETPPAPPDKVEEATPEDIVPEEPEEKEPEPKEEEPEPEPKEDKPKRDALDDLLADNPFQAEEQVLIDKAARAPVRAPQPQTPPEEPPEELRSSEGRRGVVEGTGNQARIDAIVKAQMEVCWGTVADLPDPERLSVTIKVKLKRDGTIDGDAEPVSPRRARIGDRFMQQAIDRALRAARQCSPYRLPADDYDLWNEVTLNFIHEEQ